LNRRRKKASSLSGLKKLLFIAVAFCPAAVLPFVDFNGLSRTATEDVWAIGIYQGASPLELCPLEGISNPVLSIESVPGIPVETVADPFLIREKDEWFLFFEMVNGIPGQGDIAFARSADLSCWHYGGIVLDEPFHLSYPYVFRWGNDIYMIPETAQVHSVRLYRAAAFPFRWEYVRTLIHSEGIADASIFQTGGKWWILAGSTACDTLRLYYADELKGSWKEHPKSPLYEGNLFFSRPAGRVVTWESKLFRFAQQDVPTYGRQVWAFEVVVLTEDDYEERPVSNQPVLMPGEKTTWNEMGMHHVDFHRLSGGKGVAAVDGFRHHRSVGVFMNRVFCKFRRFYEHLFQGDNDF